MGLHQNLINESVSRLPLREAAVCTAEDSVRTAVERMREQELGCVIIIDEERRPVGMFTESILTQMLARGTVDFDVPVRKHMADHWPWVKRNEPIADIIDAMRIKNVRFICVVDDESRVVALAGQKSLIEYVADHFPEQVMVQRVGCAPFQDREGA